MFVERALKYVRSSESTVLGHRLDVTRAQSLLDTESTSMVALCSDCDELKRQLHSLEQHRIVQCFELSEVKSLHEKTGEEVDSVVVSE